MLIGRALGMLPPTAEVQMFESKTIGDLVRIAENGGGMEIRVGARTTGDIVRLAEAAARGGCRIYLRGLAARAMPDLVRIAAAGRGSVVFADPHPGE